ncbi:MAG: tRNA threonylcarbamoyladenosine dehydratase [Burkholderiales bacterium]|nr:tRNA threonylcarbamoyladenosine dehydratase [Burkholderiales bacterium]
MTQHQTERRFGGLDRLYGTSGAQAIRNAHAAVIGIGGVGSWAAEALARSGIGKLTLIDFDHIVESNINRQIHATELSLGMEKVLAMKERIALINPHCVVQCVDEFVTPENWPNILGSQVEAVIDACDQMHAKVAMAAWAMQTKNIFICVGAAGGKRFAHKVDIDDLSQTTHDPLLSQLRYRLRRNHNAPKDKKKIGVDCVYSKESVAPAQSNFQNEFVQDGTLNCSGYGSVVSVTATFGQCAAGWVIDKISTL